MSSAVLTASPEAVEEFKTEGYLILRDFIDPSIVENVRADTQKFIEKHIQDLKARGKITDTFPNEPFETRLARVYENCTERIPGVFRTQLHLAGFYPFFFNRHLLDVVGGLLGPEVRLYPNYSIRPKLPDNAATLVLWHQDGGYTESGTTPGDLTVDQLRMVNVWSPLVPANVENGCMQFIPRTHKLGAVKHVGKEYYLEIDQSVLAPRLKDAVDIEMNPGDVVLFSNMLFHRGLPNKTKAVRWSSDWRYQDATQPTLRNLNGHLARSKKHPEQVVKSAKQWTELTMT